MAMQRQQLLENFERLSEAEKRAVAAEIIRRTLMFDLPCLTDEELVLTADSLFLELDQRESRNECA